MPSRPGTRALPSGSPWTARSIPSTPCVDRTSFPRGTWEQDFRDSSPISTIIGCHGLYTTRVPQAAESTGSEDGTRGTPTAPETSVTPHVQTEIDGGRRGVSDFLLADSSFAPRPRGVWRAATENHQRVSAWKARRLPCGEGLRWGAALGKDIPGSPATPVPWPSALDRIRPRLRPVLRAVLRWRSCGPYPSR